MIPLHHVPLISCLAICVSRIVVVLMELTGSAVDPIGSEEVELDTSRGAKAQLVARTSHYHKVANSILTCHTLVATRTACFEQSRNTAQCTAIPPDRNCRIEDMFVSIPRIAVEKIIVLDPLHTA